MFLALMAGNSPTSSAATTLVSITVSPSSLTAPVGGSQQFTATGHFSDGSTRDLTASVTWISSAPAVATISSSGLATA